MSSVYVRDQIKTFIAANSAEKVVDLTAAFEEIKELLVVEGVTTDAPWLGLQFIGDDEEPIALAATNDQGKYREFGSIFFHVCAIAQLGAANGPNGLLTRGEALRNLLRGRHIGDIIIQHVTPMNFDSGATLQFEGGYVSGSFQVAYQRDLDL